MEMHKCDDCIYDANTKKANTKCRYCLDWCNYVSVNKRKFFIRIVIISAIPVLLLIVILVWR